MYIAYNDDDNGDNQKRLNRKSHMGFQLVPWMANTHFIAQKMHFLEPTTKIWMKVDSYYQQQKWRPTAW